MPPGLFCLPRPRHDPTPHSRRLHARRRTSKGVFFLAHDLPADPAARDRLLLRVIGSPDRYGKHIDGMGGASSSTSTVVSRLARRLMEGFVRVPAG